MSETVNSLARRLAHESPQGALMRHRGVVQALGTTAGTVDITLDGSGAVLAGVAHLASYIPTVGDTVEVVVDNTDVMVLGNLGTEPAEEPIVIPPGVPVGGIILWSGLLTDIPDGWALCNGLNGTPDLRDRFVVGAGTSYNPGGTGGANTVALSINEIPSHAHAPGNLSLGNHTHPITDHSHAKGNLVTDAHSHAANNIVINSHQHSPGTFALGNHSHAVGNIANSGGGNHSHQYTRENLSGGFASGNTTYRVSGSTGVATDSVNSAHNHTIAGSTSLESLTVNSGLSAWGDVSAYNNTGAANATSISGATGLMNAVANSGNQNAVTYLAGETGYNGYSNAHENRPPYYALAYIMKL